MYNTLKAPDSSVPSIASCQNLEFCSKKRTESEQFFRAESEQFWHDAIDGTLLSGAFRVLRIDNHLALDEYVLKMPLDIQIGSLSVEHNVS